MSERTAKNARRAIERAKKEVSADLVTRAPKILRDGVAFALNAPLRTRINAGWALARGKDAGLILKAIGDGARQHDIDVAQAKQDAERERAGEGLGSPDRPGNGVASASGGPPPPLSAPSS